MGIVVTMSGLTAVGGRYYTRAGIEGIYGQNNVAKWSNKEGDSTTADTTAIATEGSATDDEIDSRARRAGYAVPIPSTSKDFSRIQYIANEITGVRLYMGRGEIQNADTQSIAGQMEKHRQRAYDELDELLFGTVPGMGLDAPRASGWSNAPVAVAASVDPSGVPVGVAPFGRWTWDGFQYRWTT
jgi:hypothetical protein